MVAMAEVAERTNDFFRSFLPAVNSPPVVHREAGVTATGLYRPYTEEYAHVQRVRPEHAVHPEVEAERSKKDKKWSIGKLFRRKKKDEESASSSESDEGVSTRSSKKKSKKKKKAATTVGNFDHIVMRDGRRAQSLVKHNNREINDEGVLSDPSAGFINYRAKVPYENYVASKDSLNLRDDGFNKPGTGKGLVESTTRKTRKGRRKARVEALRNSLIGDTSSDEDSVKSSNSSSMVRFRSDDSLLRSRDSSLNRKSRSARNERHSKRLSRDEENQLNKEAELLQQGYTKAEVEMLTRTPTSQSSGYGTCKRDSQPSNIKTDQHLHVNDLNRRPMKSESISSFPSTQSYPSSINFNAKVNNDRINYSIQYPATNIAREPVYANNRDNITDQYDNSEKVMCIKFPLGNVTNIKKDERSPPVPPPRDMHRKIATPISMYYENNPIVADRMGANRNAVHGVQNNDFDRVIRRSQDRSMNPTMNGLRRPISSSEDHIAMQNNEYFYNYNSHKNDQPRRPASVSAEPNHYALYTNTPPWRKIDQPRIVKPEPIPSRQDYLYFADQSPRSRRPISIKPSQNGHDNQYLSDSHASLCVSESGYRKPRNASEFWKKLDHAEKQRRQENVYTRHFNDVSNNPIVSQRPKVNVELNHGQQKPLERIAKPEASIQKPEIETKCKLTLHTQPRVANEGPKMWKATTEYKRSITAEPPKTVISPTSKTHVRHKSDTFIQSSYQVPSDDERFSERRKSTNLDDALNELEAIYNSLGLGDEDLLDRAERRESMTPKFNDINDWNGNDEVELRSQPTTPLRRMQRRSTLPDKLQDDMAFRRMNSKEKTVSKDSQAQMSYILASPVYIPYTSDDDRHSDRNEPDIVHDDVVYRNIKQTNNRLKTMDPQPPFGIPVGPVSPAPQSDYLHATPENRARSRFIPKRSPDLVSDDLAYRSLRKDNTRHSSLFNGEEYNVHNNNQNYGEFVLTNESAANLKKKRAVRSLSANIFTMIQKEIDDALNMTKPTTLHKTHSNHDVNLRLRDSKEINDNNQDNYPRNKVKQRHNTVSLFVNNTHPPHHFAKDDSFIYTDDKYLAKPPSCDKSKSSSPSNRSPQTSKRSSKDEFQQVLTMLAQEAMDTSNKLGVALAELDKNRNNNERKSVIQNKLSDSRLNFLNTLTNKSSSDINLQEIRHVKVHSEIVNNANIDKPVLQTFENNLKAKKTEDSLLAISNQLNKVEDKLKHSIEKEINFEDESVKLSQCVMKGEEKMKAQEATAVLPENKLTPEIVPLSVRNDVFNVQNIDRPKQSENKIEKNIDLPIESISQSSDSKIKELNEIRAFKELKDGISDLIAGISQVNDKVIITSNNRHVSNAVEKSKVGGITEASEKLLKATQDIQKEDPINRASVNLSIYEDDLEVKKETTDSTEYNSSEELATIFRLDQNFKSISQNRNDTNTKAGETKRDDLSSPKLVQCMNQQLRRFSVDNTDDVHPSQSSSLPNAVPWRTKRQNNPSNSQKDDTGDSEERKRPWHRSPGTLMLACTYTLVCSQHLAQLDWLTLLGLILAIITIIAMLLI